MASWSFILGEGPERQTVVADTLIEASMAAREVADAAETVFYDLVMVDESAALRASAITKLIAGQPLTEAEAIAIASSNPV